jgi:hypothetical protein
MLIHFTFQVGSFPAHFSSRLEVSSSKAPNRDRQTKVSQGEGGPSCRNPLKHIIKINIAASNGNNRALEEVGAKNDDIPKTLENNG